MEGKRSSGRVKVRMWAVWVVSMLKLALFSGLKSHIKYVEMTYFNYLCF